MTSIERNDPTTKLDGELPSTTEVAAPMTAEMSAVAAAPAPSPMSSTKAKVIAASNKKRALRLPHQRLSLKRHMLKHQGSSDLQPKHRNFTSVGHLKRVEFSLFLKILMHHLSMKDEDFVKQARAVVLDTIKSQREGNLPVPLISALKGRLFGLVGKNDWEICERYLQRYLAYHNIVTEL